MKIKKIIITFCLLLSLCSCNSQNNKVNKDEISALIPNDKYILDSVSIKSMNKNFKLLVLEKKQFKRENAPHNSLSILIFEKTIEGKLVLKVNNNNIVFKYDDNCPADGFLKVVAKNNFFTIEQVYCKDFLFVNSYVTFKYDNKESEFVLHKYGEMFTDRGNPDKDIPTVTKSVKDFGKILFNDVSQEMLVILIK